MARVAWDWIDKEKLWRWRRREGRSLQWCATQLGRTVKAVDVMLKKLATDRDQSGLRCGTVERVEPSAEALAIRERRLACEPRDLTALLCGDPLPGWSALDER